MSEIQSKQIMLPHVHMKPRVPPPRPARDSEDVLQRVAQQLCAQLGFPTTEKEEKTGVGDESEYADILNVLIDAVPDLDGYGLARALESDHYWEIDAGMVSTLDNAPYLHRCEYNKQVQAWVTNYELEPKYAQGTQCTVVRRGKRYRGTIIKVDAKNLTYTVAVPELGHGSATQNDSFQTIGLCILEEELTL